MLSISIKLISYHFNHLHLHSKDQKFVYYPGHAEKIICTLQIFGFEIIHELEITDNNNDEARLVSVGEDKNVCSIKTGMNDLLDYLGSVACAMKGVEIIVQSVIKMTQGRQGEAGGQRTPCILEISDKGIKMVDKSKPGVSLSSSFAGVI